jgi:hypothetical protein
MKSFTKVNEYITKEFRQKLWKSQQREGATWLVGRTVEDKLYCALSSQSFIVTFCLHRVGMNGQVLRSGTIQEKIVPT